MLRASFGPDPEPCREGADWWRFSSMILAVSSRAFVDACARMGLDVDSLVRDAEISKAMLRDPDGRLSAESVGRLWALAHARSGDADLALHAAEALPFGAYRVIDFLVANAPTIGAGLSKLAEYFKIINPAVRVDLVTEGERACFRLRPLVPETIGRAYDEYTLCACFLRSRISMGIDFPLRTVNFRHGAPAATDEHQRIFECPVRFGQPLSEWVMDASLLASPVDHANSDLFSVLDRHASELARQLPTSALVEALKQILTERMHSGSTSLAHAATAMAMSPRSLQRVLAAEGLTFRAVLDTLRRELAVAALDQKRLSIGEVGFLLGFATPASFCRAFKRWTGESPKEWRERTRAGQRLARSEP